MKMKARRQSRCRLAIFLFLCVSLALFGRASFGQDDAEQTTAALSASTASETGQPNEATTVIGPAGDLPHDLSMPPTGYRSLPSESTFSVAGGVNVTVSDRQLKLDADFWRIDFDEGEAVKVVANGNVRAVYQEYTVKSSKAIVDLTTNVAQFSGDVELIVSGQNATGQELTISLDTRQWVFDDGSSQLKPEVFPDIIRAPIFLTGDKVSGISDKLIEISDGTFTTCDLPNPHFKLKVREASIWPDSKLIAKDSSLYAFGHKLFDISRLSIPLKDIRERQGFFPQVGLTEEEGLFVKTAYTVQAGRKSVVNAKVDLMTKKGIGLGLDDTYARKNGIGALNVYWLSDRNQDLNTLTGRFSHQQKIGSVTADLIADYRSNSYMFSPASTSLSNELRLRRSKTGQNSRFGIRHNTNRGFGKYSQLSSNFQHSQALGENSDATFALDYFRSESPIQYQGNLINAATAQLSSRLAYNHRSALYDWSLRFDKINDLSDEAFISQGSGQFAGIERLPELELTSSSDRLKRVLPFGIPAQFGLAVGRYREGLGRVDTERLVANLTVPNRSYELGNNLELAASGGFKQYVYGDHTAQYVVDSALDLSRKIGDKSTVSLSYRYLRPNGYTPFRFDFIGKYNILEGRINIQESKKLRLSLASGYNFEEKTFPWEDISLRATYQPSDRLLLFTSAGIDLNRSEWRPLVNQIRLRLPGDFRLDVGSRYDIERHQFSSFKTRLDTPIGKLWRLRASTGYNGYTKSFDYKDFQIVRDLHCMELAVTWVDERTYWQERGLRINLRIKAFPIFDSFGVGQSGQLLDTSVGEML